MVIKVKENIQLGDITHHQILILIQEELIRVLENIPVLTDVDVFNSENNEYDLKAQASINLNERLTIICEVKSKAEPQYVRQAAQQISRHRLGSKADNYYCMIAAPYISQASSKICEEMGVGYIDLSGNCLIKHNSIYVRVEGKPNKFGERRGIKSIFERSSTKSSMILRYILQEPDKRWKMQELADISSSSIGQVSKVKKFLEERELISVAEGGFSINKPKEVILEWAKVYNLKQNTTIECYSLYSIPQIEQKINEIRYKKGIECVLTGFSGAVRYTPTVRYNKIHVYVPLQDLQETINFLECKKVTSGSNISMIVPYDSCILTDTRNIKNSIVASPVQVCLELLGLKSRGEEAANAILDKEYMTYER